MITTYSYDAAGNRTVKNEGGVRTTYAYDAANRMRRSEDAGGITTFTFDNNGNQRRMMSPTGDITTYSWSYENQLKRIEDPDNALTTSTWAPVNRNGVEQRIAKETEDVLTNYLWDDQRLLQETDEVGTIEAEYTLQPKPQANLVSQRRASESSFYSFDALGSTAALTDGTQAETDRYAYKPFGDVRSSSGTTQNPFLWRGSRGAYHDDSGFYSIRNLQYLANQGRFVQQAEPSATLNLYAQNDPTGAPVNDSASELESAQEEYDAAMEAHDAWAGEQPEVRSPLEGPDDGYEEWLRWMRRGEELDTRLRAASERLIELTRDHTPCSRFGFGSRSENQEMSRSELESILSPDSPLSEMEIRMLDDGCIGLCALRQGQGRDVYYPPEGGLALFCPPVDLPGTRCFRSLPQALHFECPPNKIKHIFQVRGFGLNSNWTRDQPGDPPTVIDDETGEIDPSTMFLAPETPEQRLEVTNRRLLPTFDFATYLGNGCWEQVSRGIGKDLEGNEVTRETQGFYITCGTPLVGPDQAYPYEMFCVTCKDKDC